MSTSRIEQPRESFGRSLLLGILLASFVGVGCLIPWGLRHQISPTLVPLGTQPEEVLDILKGLSKDDRVALVEQERRQLISEPLDLTALIGLATLAGLDGDKATNDGLVTLAANRGVRDFPTQSAVLDLLLKKRDYVGAGYRLDGLLREQPTESTLLYNTLLTLAGEPDGLTVVANLLAKQPPWRAGFMKFAAGQPTQANVFYDLLVQLRSSDARASDDELRPYLQYLVETGKFEAAYFVWLDSLSADDLRKAGLVFDGGFDLQPRNMVFDWNIIAIPNAQITVELRPGSSINMALKLDFVESKGGFANVFQFLRLDSGKYQLTGEALAEKFQSPGGLKWELRCAESGEVIGGGPKLLDSQPWTNFEINFEIPPQNCTTQRLALVSASTAVLDQVLNGSLFFDAFQISKLEQ